MQDQTTRSWRPSSLPDPHQCHSSSISPKSEIYPNFRSYAHVSLRDNGVWLGAAYLKSMDTKLGALSLIALYGSQFKSLFTSRWLSMFHSTTKSIISCSVRRQSFLLHLWCATWRIADLHLSDLSWRLYIINYSLVACVMSSENAVEYGRLVIQ